MRERLRALSDLELGRALSELGSRLEYPPTPPLAEIVVARLEREPAGGRAGFRLPGWLRLPMRWPPPSRRRVLVLATLGFLLLAAAAAVAIRLAVSRVEIRVTPTPRPVPSRIAGDLGLGRAVTLREARSLVEFDVRTIGQPGLETPDEVYFDAGPIGGQVALVYRARPELPPIADTRAGLILTQFGGEVGGLKEVSPTQRVESVSVNGQPGLWVEGVHSFFYEQPEGGNGFIEGRLAGNTLIWQSGDLVLRLESSLSLEEALRIAETVTGPVR
jgi:hypothetical protein